MEVVQLSGEFSWLNRASSSVLKDYNSSTKDCPEKKKKKKFRNKDFMKYEA